MNLVGKPYAGKPHVRFDEGYRLTVSLACFYSTAITLTIFFDLSRIASIGAIFYLLMDMIVHWGVYRHLRKDVHARGAILISALLLDFVVLLAFLWVKASSDILLVIIAVVGVMLVFTGEKWFLHWKERSA